MRLSGANIFEKVPVQTGGVERFTLRRENTLTREHLVRRLTAIFAADVAGYSRLTGMAEEGTHVRLKEHLRVLIGPKIAAHRGHIVTARVQGAARSRSRICE